MGVEFWKKTFGSSSKDAGYTVKEKPDRNFVLVGKGLNNNKETMLFIETFADGSITREKYFDLSESSGQDIIFTPDGGYYSV